MKRSTRRGRLAQLRIASVVGFALLLVAGLAAVSSAAVSDDGDAGPVVSRFAHIDASLYERAGGAANWLPASMSEKPVTAMLRLAGQPVAVAQSDAAEHGKKLTDAQKAQIRGGLKAQQDALASGIKKTGATIIGQLQDAYNGILVHTQEKNLAALAALPGVAEIQSVGLYTVPSNVNGVPLIGGPAAWGSAAGVTGAGVKIGIIDTGIDYTHADFGGPGTAAAWADAKASSTTAANPAWFGPAAPKVKGGYDFSGDAYDANVAGSVPQPDPNPLDCYGHGSHVAGTAAGFGVLADGSTYSGSYGASTVSGNSWKIGPGVAPKADVYAYRVFGCAGSTDLVVEAINRAVQDGVDVISMSLGSPFGQSANADTVAVNNAVAAGITVVAAAGNEGTSAYMVGSPSTADHALSVAAVDGSLPTYPGATFALSTGKTLTAIDANGATFANGTTLPVKVLRDSSGGVSLGCDLSEYQSQGVVGKLVVVQRGVCARVARAVFGQEAGAAAVAMINNSSGLPPYEGPITENPDTGQQYTVTIPLFGVKGPVTGTDATNLVAADGGTVTLSNTTVPNTGYMRSASFTSGGPRVGDSAPKPEVSAPGVSVLSVKMGGGSAGAYNSGTSMATPMTSGAAALVIQAHPTFTADQVKAALVNTANPSLIGGYNGRVNGAGFVQVQNAVATDSVATTSDGLDSLAFGYLPGTADYSDARSFTIANAGSSDVTYNLAGSANLGTVGVSPSSVTVPAGGSATVHVTLSIPAALFASLPGASSFTTGLGSVVTVRGAVTATPSSGPTLRVPLLAAPRGLSSVTAAALAPYVKQQTNNVYTTSTALANSGIHSGTADVYAWGIHDAQDLSGNATWDVRDVGVQSFSDGTVVFAVNGWNQSSTQATQEYDVAIDTQNNGKPDFYVVGVDLGEVLTGTYNGIFGSFTIDAKTGALVDAFYADAPMNGSTVELPTTAADLGLHAASTSFHYAVASYSAYGGAAPDTTGWAAYDLAKPGVSTGSFATLGAGGSGSLALAADYDALQSAPALGWLVVSLDNAGGPAQASEVPLGSLK